MQGAMDPDFLINVIAAIAVFLLKSTLAFAACAAVSRLAYSPKFRFVLWSGFVYGTAVYWLYLASALWRPLAQSTAAVTVTSQPVVFSFPIWQIPSSWAFPLGLTLRIIGIAYLAAVGYSIFAHLKKYRYLRWVLTFTSEPPAEIAETFESVARELHASRSRLLILSGATSPVTFGWVRPVVLLPSSCVEEDHSELEDILRHELHHVHRWDAIWNELALAARVLLIFHPAVWYAVRKMQFERELACDLAVVARCPARRAEYAECLVRFARLNVVSETSSWGIDFAASAHHLTVRVHSILAASKTFPRWTRYLRVACGLTVSALFLGVAPSLAILLSFAHQPVSNSSFTSIADMPPSELRKEIRTSRRGRSVPLLAKGHGQVEAVRPEPQGEDRSQIDLQPDTVPRTLSVQNGSGPQLRRRGDPSAQGAKGVTSETIALVDVDAKGQPIKSDDSKQAVQQTATAALGIYKRISAVDRH
jgi:beta-lactamase regulating signal transducer with metallopeptidase domain